MQLLQNTLIQIGAFGKRRFCVKFECVFSDPECPFVCCVWDMLNAISIILRGRQGTLKSGV